MKSKREGFTIVELLTTLAIMAILVGVLIPALNMVRNTARKTKQQAQFATIGQAIMAFKNDYGKYPESYLDDSTTGFYYCGAQKLAEALVGRDLLGFNKYSDWNPTTLTYYPGTQPALDNSLDDRIGPYLELTTANAFRLGNISIDKPGLFDNTGELAPDTFVLCDSFATQKIDIGGTIYKAGKPVLYYKANTTSKMIDFGPKDRRIYNKLDNTDLIDLYTTPTYQSKLLEDNYFYSTDFIIDPKVTTDLKAWPHRADSYILVSAGPDGKYGTSDDITNF